MSDEEEFIVGDDDEGDVDDFDDTGSSQIAPPAEELLVDKAKIIKEVELCNLYLPYLHMKIEGATLSFIIPTNVLPLSLQMVCGFVIDSILLYISISFDKYVDWKKKPLSFDIKHSVYNQNYIGRPLVLDAVRNFFSNSYIPADTYHSIANVFNAPGVADKNKLQTLIAEGFDPECAEKSLIINNNDLSKSKIFLLTGKDPQTIVYCPLSYDDSPPLFLVLEIIECFLDLSDHCCICRNSLSFAGIRPQVCSSKLCFVAFNEIGVGSSVSQEIRRDPLAADWIVSVFSGSYQNIKYQTPSPDNKDLPPDVCKRVLFTMPSMAEISTQCFTDSDISRNYGRETLDFLRWTLLSNQSQVISLNDDTMRIQKVPTKNQFMTIISAPEAELDFLARKKKYGSQFMWHGSSGERWHSILRNGLRNMSGVPGEMMHGACFGPGIYFAKMSSASFAYSAPMENLYRRSTLGTKVSLIALCEVANVSGKLKDHGHLWTLTDEKACVVRFIFASAQIFSVPCKIGKVPTLEEIIRKQGARAIENNEINIHAGNNNNNEHKINGGRKNNNNRKNNNYKTVNKRNRNKNNYNENNQENNNGGDFSVDELKKKVNEIVFVTSEDSDGMFN